MSDSVIKAGPVTTAHTSNHNWFCMARCHPDLSAGDLQTGAAMSGPLLKTAAATTVDTPRHYFKPLNLVFGLSTTFQTSVRKGFNKQQQQTPVQFRAQDMSSNNTSNNHSWHPTKTVSVPQNCVLDGPLPFQTSSWKVLKNGNVHF